MQAQGNPIFLWIIIFGIMYFIVIRPQRKKMKEHQLLLNNLKKGDQIVTTGGICGKVVGIKGNIINVEIADNVVIGIVKSSVGQIVQPNQEIQAIEAK